MVLLSRGSTYSQDYIGGERENKKLFVIMIVMSMFTCLNVYVKASTDELSEYGITMISQQGEVTVFNVTEKLQADCLEEFIPKHITKYDEIQGGESTNGVIGRDDRLKVKDTSKFPYCSIGMIQVEYHFSNGKTETYSGTAWMLDNHIAITACHIVARYDEGLREAIFPSKILFAPGYSGDSGAKKIYGADLVVLNPDYLEALVKVGNTDNTAISDVKYDFALVGFKDDIGIETGHLGALSYCNKYKTYFKAGTGISTAGYPGEVLGGENDNNYMYSVGGKINKEYSGYFSLSNDASQGQSGSPVFLNNDVNYRS